MQMTLAADEETGDRPVLDGRALRQCLGQFATGVTVMTALAGQARVGVTANSFSSLSLEPPLVLWSIKRTSRSLASFQAATHFCVNVLAADQVALSQQFAGSAEDKFAGVAWRSGIAGTPVLDGVAATIECEREAQIDGGDHIILIGRVVNFTNRMSNVLLFAQGQYGIVARHPDVQTSLSSAASDEPSRHEGADLSLSGLLYWSQYYFSKEFEEHRKAENLSLPQSRILFVISEYPGIGWSALVSKSYIEESAVGDSLAELAERGLIGQVNGLWEITSEGRELRKRVRARQTEFEQRLLAGLNEADERAARRFLSVLVSRLKQRFDH